MPAVVITWLPTAPALCISAVRRRAVRWLRRNSTTISTMLATTISRKRPPPPEFLAEEAARIHNGWAGTVQPFDENWWCRAGAGRTRGRGGASLGQEAMTDKAPTLTVRVQDITTTVNL